MTVVLRRVRHHRCCVPLLLTVISVSLCLYYEKSPLLLNSYRRYGSGGAPCACGACVLERNSSGWFSARYDASVHLLLNSSNRALRSPVYGWWKGLQNVSRVSNYTEVCEQLFPLFPDEHHYSDSGPDRCRTCAVVGNSGNLLRSHYGPLIDSNDFVLRINKGPTKGFEKDVGSRTTHRFMYPESATDVGNSTHLVLSPFKILDIEWLISAFTTKNITKTYMKVPSAVKGNRDKVLILHPEFIRYVHENWTENNGRYPSTGFLTIIFALHICDEVNVFGFGATNQGNWHHYFDKTLTPFVNESHAGDYEYKMVSRLHLEKKILMYKGWT